MKRLFSLFIVLFSLSLQVQSQPLPADSTALRPFEGHFYCEETGVNIFLNLYEENIEVPNFAFLGKMHGYMLGNIYGTWMLVSHEINGSKALLRFSNDIGSDTQDIEFVQVSDSTYTYHAKGGNAIRRAVGRNLVKVTGDMEFCRK